MTPQFNTALRHISIECKFNCCFQLRSTFVAVEKKGREKKNLRYQKAIMLCFFSLLGLLNSYHTHSHTLSESDINFFTLSYIFLLLFYYYFFSRFFFIGLIIHVYIFNARVLFCFAHTKSLFFKRKRKKNIYERTKKFTIQLCCVFFVTLLGSQLKR